MNNKTEIKKVSNVIDNFYSRMSNLDYDIDKSLREAVVQEKIIYKNHARFSTVLESAKISVLKFIFDGLRFKPTPKDFLHVRLGCFMAYAIADEFQNKIEREFTLAERIQLQKIFESSCFVEIGE